VICHDVERDLDPYIDREVAPDSAAAIRVHLRTCVACRRRLADRESLGRLVRSVPYHSAPDRLRAKVATQVNRSTAIRRVLPWAAAAALAASVLGAVWLARPNATARGSAIVEEVVADHVRSLMADHLFDVESTDQHTVKPWFLGKLDFSPPVTDLSAIGFPLVGGRLDYLAGKPVAALVYRRRQHTINVFIGRSAADPSAEIVAAISGFHMRHWMRGGMDFWAVSDLNETELEEFCRTLQAE
jgi:anti-sigma factor RsiW